jgi:PIN domain nuclease of toxin-antitoxin system
VRLAVPPLLWFAILIVHHGLREVPRDAETASAAAALAPLHRDPFNRVIVALAQSRNAIVLTSDERIRQYPGVTVHW